MATAIATTSASSNLLSLRKTDGAGKGALSAWGKEPRHFPIAPTPPRLPALIPDEILEYYGWLFCQGGFCNLDMTFEGFLTVIAAISPSSFGGEDEADAPAPPAE